MLQQQHDEFCCLKEAGATVRHRVLIMALGIWRKGGYHENGTGHIPISWQTQGHYVSHGTCPFQFEYHTFKESEIDIT